MNSEELTKQRPGQSAVFYTLAAQIQHQRQPLLAVGVTVERHAKTVIFCIENDGMSVSGVRLGIDTEAVLQHNTTLWRYTRLEFLLTVEVLETCRTRAALFAKNEQLLFVRLKTEHALSVLVRKTKVLKLTR